MSYITQKDYYTNNGTTPTSANWGSYAKVFLPDLVNNFVLMYSGNHELVNNEPRYKILFHARRSIQELNYDAAGILTSLQLTVGEDLRFIFPPDYVNFVKLWLFKDDGLVQMTESIYPMSAIQYEQSADGSVEFYGDDVIFLTPSQIDEARLTNHLKTPYLNNQVPNNALNGQWGWYIDNIWYFDRSIGGVIGLNSETATTAPTYSVDKTAGVFNFSSDMANQSCILEYISDGQLQGQDELIYVNKMFEEYIYADIEYRIMKSKLGVQEYVIRRLQKQKSALLANAKIRVSNLKAARLLMNLRGLGKMIK